jgi:quinol monooxygenase YgiN
VGVIAVVQRRARTGQTEALIDAARRRWMGPGPWPSGRRHVRLFQGTEEPERIIYVAEWESAETYWANRRGAAADGLDVLSVAPAMPRLYAWRWRYQNLARTPIMLSAVTLSVPQPVLAETLASVDAARDRVRAAEGLVLHLFCEDMDDPGQLLILQGWTTPEAMAAHRQDPVPSLLAGHRARGVRVDPFVGQRRAEEDHWAHLAVVRAAGGIRA